jgi:hypothetical protein
LVMLTAMFNLSMTEYPLWIPTKTMSFLSLMYAGDPLWPD